MSPTMMLAGGAVAACLIAFGTGYGTGRIHQSKIHSTELLEAQVTGFEEAERISDELLSVQRQLRQARTSLEEAANADVNHKPTVCLPLSGVQRLNLR